MNNEIGHYRLVRICKKDANKWFQAVGLLG